MRETPVIISVKDVTAGYGSRAVLEHVTFDIRAGEVFTILGGSGCGKSTMLKHLIGLNPVLSGTITIDGLEMNATNRTTLIRRFGVMYQSGALFGSMTLLENVMLPLEEFTSLPREMRELSALMKLDLVGLRDYAEFLPADISGGMKKRAAIARAMALEPSILFLDEPSAGLDPVTSAGLDRLILRLRETQGITFVIVTHELQSIYAIADRCVMLDRAAQTKIAEGAPCALRDNPPNETVRKFFMREEE